jgi:mannose-6-phosphate isomerase
MHRLNLLPEDLSPTTRVAEAWAGAHPSLPSLLEDGTPLNQLIAENPLELLGERVMRQFGPNLPFLFKLLSIGAPLSIQVHPDSEKARKLHEESPERYPETNHKPEVGVAVTETKLLFGFRPLPQILSCIDDLGPLRYLVGNRRDLRSIFERILNASDEERLSASDSIVELLRIKPTLTEEERLFIALEDLYPGDPGVFQVFILNLLTLKPGEALFIQPNTPHAYLSGDIVECMAASDFVIRAGLTPKPKDFESLCEVVEYRETERSSVVPDYVREFRIELVTSTQEEIADVASPTLYFSLDGEAEVTVDETAHPLRSGELLLVPACISSHRVSSSGTLFRVYVPN